MSNLDVFWNISPIIWAIFDVFLLIIATGMLLFGWNLYRENRNYLRIKNEYKNLIQEIQKYKDIESDIENATEEKLHLKESNILLKAEVNSNKKTAEAFDKKSAELEIINKEFSKKGVEIARMDKVKVLYDSLLTDNNNLNKDKKSLEIEIRNLQDEIKSINQEFDDIDYKRRDLKEINEKLMTAKDTLLELEQKEAALVRKKAELNDLEKKKKELGSSIEDEEQIQEKTFESLKEKIENIEIVSNTIQPESEVKFLNDFESKLKENKILIHKRLINSFHTSLKIQDTSALTVLAGISGTGKSMLPQLYADLADMNFVMLPVQPRWDSSQDILGLYNYAEKKYKATILARLLHQYKNASLNKITIFLFDEMNLARVEYYFSDFLSQLELRTKDEEKAVVILDLGATKMASKYKKIPISKKIFFVGTINEDDTTQTFSDKVLDRSNLIRFNAPQNLKWINPFNIEGNTLKEPICRIDYLTFMKWTKKPTPEFEKFDDTMKIFKDINRKLIELDRPFAHRLAQSMMTYIVNYPGVEENDKYWQNAISDQIAQKIMPKLRGVEIEDAENKKNLEGILEIIKKDIEDSCLIEAFQKSQNSNTGFFQWLGIQYPEENE